MEKSTYLLPEVAPAEYRIVMDINHLFFHKVNVVVDSRKTEDTDR